MDGALMRRVATKPFVAVPHQLEGRLCGVFEFEYFVECLSTAGKLVAKMVKQMQIFEISEH